MTERDEARERERKKVSDERMKVTVASEVGSKDKNRNVQIRSPVSLQLPGNRKVWLASRCQVIIAAKTISILFITTVKTERRETFAMELEKNRPASKTRRSGLLKRAADRAHML